MQIKFFFTLALVVAVVLCAANVRAQQTNPPAESKQAADAALREKAFDLLKSLAGELGTLQSPENRARIGSNIAESLWSQDENRARELFTRVQEDINLGLQGPATDAPEDIKTLMVFVKLRADTTERIAKHDPEFAYEFFKATALSRETSMPRYVWENINSLEAHLAKQLSATNPDLSLDIARKMLARGDYDDLRVLLRRLNRKHKAQSTVLYKEIIRKLADVDLAEDWSARNFALNLAASFGPPKIDEATFKELVKLFIKPVTENGCLKNLDNEDEWTDVCKVLAPALPLIARVDPSRARDLQRLAQRSGYYLLENPYYEINELLSEGSVDEMLALIEQYPQMEFEIRFRAVQKAQREGDPERARKILAEYTSDPVRQSALVEQLDRMQHRQSITNEQLEAVLKRVSELENPARKLPYLWAAANLVGDNDHKAALKLLNQSAEIIETLKPGKEQTAAQIFLAIMYCYEKNNRGLEIMETLMPKLNELVASASKLDGYDTHYLREGEWNMTAEGELGSLLTSLAGHADYFAWFDFDRAVSLAGQFERAEIRIMAQLKLAQGVLAGPPTRMEFADY